MICSRKRAGERPVQYSFGFGQLVELLLDDFVGPRGLPRSLEDQRLGSVKLRIIRKSGRLPWDADRQNLPGIRQGFLGTCHVGR